MQTPLGPSQNVLIRGVSLFHGLFLYICKICSGLHPVSALQWMSVFQGCPQGEVLLYCGCIKNVCCMTADFEAMVTLDLGVNFLMLLNYNTSKRSRDVVVRCVRRQQLASVLF